MLLLCLVLSVAALSSCGGGGSENGGGSGESGGGSGESGGESGGSGEEGGESGGESGEKTYVVRVTMGDGSPATSFIVQITKGAENVAMKRVGDDGTVSFKLAANDYDIALIPVNNINYYVDQTQLKLSKDTDGANIQLYNVPDREESVTVREGEDAPSKNKIAYHVSAGAYRTELEDDGYTYFIFIPTERGIFDFIAYDGDERLDIGYFGSPDNPMSFNLSDTSDGKLSLEVRKYNLAASGNYATKYLIGIKGDASDSAVFEIVKSDKELDVDAQEVEWINYKPEKAPEKHTVSYANKKVALWDLDIAGEDIVLVLGDDGYYRLGTADGPIVYVKVDCESKYLGAFSNVAENGQFCSYFYDENGEFTHKESYNEAITEYVAASDEATGIYPLDEYLREVIIKCGEFLGWWNPKSMNYRFESVSYNENNVWMFALCTVEANTLGNDATAPYLLFDEGKILLAEGEISYATCNLNAGERITLRNLPVGSSVTVDGNALEIKDGRVSFTATESCAVVLCITAGGKCEISYSFS